MRSSPGLSKRLPKAHVFQDPRSSPYSLQNSKALRTFKLRKDGYGDGNEDSKWFSRNNKEKSWMQTLPVPTIGYATSYQES